MFNKAKAIKLSAKQMDKQLLFNGVYPQLIHKLIPLYSKVLKNTNYFKKNGSFLELSHIGKTKMLKKFC